MGNVIKVTVDVDGILASPNSLDELIDDDVMLEVHRVFAETIDPWTPFLTGQLSGDIVISADGVTYNVPYASEKYYGTVYHKEVHPLATSHWDEVAMQTEMDAFTARVKQILVERAKALYG